MPGRQLPFASHVPDVSQTFASGHELPADPAGHGQVGPVHPDVPPELPAPVLPPELEPVPPPELLELDPMPPPELLELPVAPPELEPLDPELPELDPTALPVSVPESTGPAPGTTHARFPLHVPPGQLAPLPIGSVPAHAPSVQTPG